MRSIGRLTHPVLMVVVLVTLTGCGEGASGTTTSPAESGSAPGATSPSAGASAAPIIQPSAGPFEASLVDGLRTQTDVFFTDQVACGHRTCAIPLDILAPSEADGVPTMVLVPGGPSDVPGRRYLAPLAAALARRGAVVFLTAYRSGSTGNSDADIATDVRCAVRYARSETTRYGGDPDRVILVGHSIASAIALQITLAPEAETPGCLGGGTSRPDAVVGLSGFDVDLSDAAPPAPPVLLAAGTEDVARDKALPLVQALEQLGVSVEYRELQGLHHGDIVDPGADPPIVDLIFDALNASGPAAPSPS